MAENKFKFYRKSLGLTQEALASKLGVKQCTVAAWESGRAHPRVTLFPKLRKVFKCKMSDLIW